MLCCIRSPMLFLVFMTSWSCFLGITDLVRFNTNSHNKHLWNDVNHEIDEISHDDVDDEIRRIIRSLPLNQLVKKAITPKRRFEYTAEEIDHHNETRRPGFPMKDVAPDMIFKYPRGDDPPIIPVPPNEQPAAALQPQVVLPPAPPAAIIVNTGSGPAATVTQVMPASASPSANKVPQPNVPLDRQRGEDDAGGGGGSGGGGDSGKNIGGNAASYYGMGGKTGGSYNGSGPAMGGEKGLAGPYWPIGSGSGIGERVAPYTTSPDTPVNWDGGGADWIGTKNGGEGDVPNPAANVGKASASGSGPTEDNSGGKNNGDSNGGGSGDKTGGATSTADGGGANTGDSSKGGAGDTTGGATSTANGGGANTEDASKGGSGGRFNSFTSGCQGDACAGTSGATVNPSASVIKMFQKLYKKFISVQQQIKNASPSEGGRPTQVAKGLLAAEMYKLEDIIYNLNKKIDIIGDRVTKRPNQLGRAALMAGMTSTFGDLQNTIETLNEKLDRNLNRQNNELLVTPISHDQQKNGDSHLLAHVLEKLGAAGWLGVNGPAIGFSNYEMAAKAAHLEGLKMATLKSNERLEDSMHLLADRLMGLQDHMDHHVHDDKEDKTEIKMDPILRQEQENLMLKQKAIMKHMTYVRAGLDKLAGAVTKLREPPKGAPAFPVNMKMVGMVQSVLKNAANAFRGIAKQTSDSSANFANHMGQTVQNAEQLVKDKNIKKYPFVLGGAKGDATLLNNGALTVGLSNGVSGLAQAIGSTTGLGAAGNPFIGSPFGLLGGNEGIPQEHIPQLAASIASIPVSEAVDSLDSTPVVASRPVITNPLDPNLFNFGTYGNGRPQMGVVTGNLGGSLGLGGIGGIDGGNALVMNRTTSKKDAICLSDIITCALTASKRTFSNTLKLQRTFSNTLKLQRRRTMTTSEKHRDMKNHRLIGTTFQRSPTETLTTDMKNRLNDVRSLRRNKQVKEKITIHHQQNNHGLRNFINKFINVENVHRKRMKKTLHL